MEVDVSEDFQNYRRLRSRFALEIGQRHDEFIEINSAFRGNLKTYYLRNGNENIKELCLLLTLNKNKIIHLINNLLSEYNALKFNIVAECTYIRPHSDETQIRTFKTSNVAILAAVSINSMLGDMFQKICREETEYEGKGSGWSLFSVDGILLRFSRYTPLSASSFIDLPNAIKLKYAVINPQNRNDNCCFMWAILAKHVNTSIISNRYFELRGRYNFNDISFPTPLNEIAKFEKQNKGVTVNVYGIGKNNEVFPLRVCDSEKTNHFDLLLLSNNDGKTHYCYIKNFSRLIRSQVTKHRASTVFCKRCFKPYQGAKRMRKLEEHKMYCKQNKPIRVKMPESNDGDGSPPKLKFENFHFKYKVPIVVYADFECLLTKVDRVQSTYTSVVEKHEPMSFCVYVVYDNDSLPENITLNLPNEPYLYRGKDAAAKFMEYLISLANLIGDLIDVNLSMIPLTVEEQNRFDTAEYCEQCNSEFTLINVPVRDHCHLTGKFRSVLCNDCNLKRQKQKFLPVFIHGSTSYDNHFIVRQLGCDQREITVIPNTNEKYVSYSKQTSSGLKLRFIDSFRFLNTSLSVLSNNLPKEEFHNVKLFFNDEDLPLVTRKGVYPYEYTDSFDKLTETRIPNKDCFYNSLTETHISDDEYSYVQEMWNRFNCKDLGEYSDLYLRIDVLLLTDVFENFRKLCLQNYELDPANYLTLPSFTFDAMLKMTKVELELLTCYDTYLFIERGIRGGIASSVKRNAIANNPHLDSYDENKDTSFLTYIDANKLYGYAMSQPMPKDGFKWLSAKKIKKFDVLSIPDDSAVGYFIECDVCYPKYLHNEHNDLPFLPENKCPPGSKARKLLTTLEDKTRYVCHYMNLKQALQNKLVLKKIHRILQFNQSTWLKSYIDLNTEKRKLAKNNFEKDFYKLLNNSMFGKSIENVRKRKSIRLVTKRRTLNRLLCKPTFRNRIIYDENLCAVECAKECVFFNKPIYIGFTVLELSKYHMYDFHYNVIKPFYKDKVNVLYLDTDSYFNLIYTKDLYEDFLNPKLNVHLDLSDYPSNHKCYSSVNKKVLGKFKDECNSIVLKEFIGLRPKLYTFTTINDQYLEKVQKLTLRKAKGVTKPVVKNHITLSDYKKCLLENIVIRKKMRMFRSRKHIVETIIVNKLALSGNDDKRHICDDGIHTLAYGHYKLENPDLSYIYDKY